jgi:hypothetical protein
MSALGKIYYYAYYKPLAFFKHAQKFGGLINLYRIDKGKRQMQKAARHLISPEPQSNALSVYFLTGKKYWALTAFCMHSLNNVSNTVLRPVFIDDGTFDDNLIKRVKKQFPGCVIKLSGEVNDVLETVLPKSKYPHINKKLRVYPHIKKLTHVHAGSTGWKMVLDSDMLFFKNPIELTAWLKNPSQPFFLHDPICSYHYSLSLMQKLAGHEITPNLNVGAIGLKSEDINWDNLEHWIGVLEEKEGPSYLLEQALSAMIGAGQSTIVASPTGYIVMPDRNEVAQPSAALHHYVGDSKEWYYKTAWRAIR